LSCAFAKISLVTAQDFGKINVSRFADTRREDAVPQLEGIWVKEDSSEKGALLPYRYTEQLL
jgi:hypothetical protein